MNNIRILGKTLWKSRHRPIALLARLQDRRKKVEEINGGRGIKMRSLKQVFLNS